jgi:AmpD protein
MAYLNSGDKELPATGTPTLEIDPATQRLIGVRFAPSPNADERPDANDISALIVHAISLPPGRFGGAGAGHSYIDDLFLNRLDPAVHPYFAGLQDLKVSAHACIFRDGSITQYVPFSARAWHAGDSSLEGRRRCNDFSVGVELEGCDEAPFTDAQYRALARLALALQRSYPLLTRARMVGHADIAPLRKTDPGPYFDWPRFHFEMDFPR